MKINVRLLLIIFSIIVLISVPSILILYSLANKILKDQQTKSILASSNDFIFNLQSRITEMDEDFNRIFSEHASISTINLDSTKIDFLFITQNDSVIVSELFKEKSSIILNKEATIIKNFVEDNPAVILKYRQFPGNGIVYYGKAINVKFLEELSEKIRAEIAFIVNDAPVEISNSEQNEKHLLSIINSVKDLKFKNVFDLYTEDLESADFIASYYSPKTYFTTDIKYGFIIFSLSSEAVDFKNLMNIILTLIILSGLALSLIFVLLFTARFRKQISLLSEAAQVAGKGEFDYHVEIISKDEIGTLGQAFNNMLDELKRRDNSEKDYLEFITLLNQNPSLNEISEEVLKKIIKFTGVAIGVLYLVEENKLRLLSAYGVSEEHAKPSEKVDYYEGAIRDKILIEKVFTKNFPIIKTGITDIKIEYLIIVPIIYNKIVVGILELASDTVPSKNIKLFIENLQEQLAIGLNNARSFEQLENMIKELKFLNDEYQKQNKLILEKNDQLVELHKKLEEKAEELEVQRLKAVELTKLKSQFLANISHELRTPLNSIIGLTELIVRDQQILPNNKNRLDIVLRNGKKLLNLINNILEFLKIESGKLEVKKEKFLLGQFLEEIRIFIEPLFVEKNLKFSVVYDDGSDYLLNADRSKIEQILINLVGNAVKFTDKGSVKIKSSIVQLSDLILEIIDTGIGISDEFKKVIFEEFRQEDSSTTRKYGGTGLGLAISKKYVQLMNGDIKFESEVNKGTKFIVTIPNIVLEKVDLSIIEEKLPVEKFGGENNYRTILLIDPEESSRRLIGDYLTLNKFNLYNVSTFSEGVEYLWENKPQAVILSANVEDKNCWVVLKELKENPDTKDIPVILISVLTDKKLGYGLGIFDYMFVKPTKQEFISRLNIIESIIHQDIKKITVIDTGKSIFNFVIELLAGHDYKINHMDNTQNIMNAISQTSSDLIIISLLNKDIDALAVINEIKHTTDTKKIPVLAFAEGELNNQMASDLSKQLNDITIRAKHHPMDVLKVLRDRLNIEYSEKLRSSILREDKEPQIEITKKRFVDRKIGEMKKRVLIVDDDSDTLFTIGEIVKELGYDSIYARNGVECLLTMNNVDPDIVLLDIMMPQMDGFETIRRIKSDSKFTNIPVIALTAYAMLDNKEVIEKNGFDDIVTKPINTNNLAFKIQKFVQSNRK